MASGGADNAAAALPLLPRRLALPSRPNPLAGIQFGATDVLSDADVREGIKRFTSWPTIPQVCMVPACLASSDGMHWRGRGRAVPQPRQDQAGQPVPSLLARTS